MDDGGSVAVSDRDQGIALKLHQEAQELRSSVGRGLYELAFRLFIIHRYELWGHVDPDIRC